ncbi:helix-turn-helix transcriptional regulator [Sphingomonas sp. Leaf257]|uniref:helix-turn-helix transcriptional regulator n=1 Tax=Sphingomonas sp. Leaf257 TaxID=1736309 RepID=UPI0006F2F3F1|nr:helix-turn-helix transcriptional regulator [Sphingomonas sp. Leaf257]KQO57687.1 hypothetical protein ASF14_14740 [Sphingomonas sp. Leaf257]
MKLNLPARVPNEGARRLAFHLTVSKPGSLKRFARKAGLSEMMVERLIRGDVMPDDDMAKAIYLASDTAVFSSHWSHRPHGGWFDRPISQVAA